MRFSLVTALALALAACSTSTHEDPDPCQNDYVPTEADFDCTRTWQKVGNLRVVNRCGRQQEAVGVAGDEKIGDLYPMGTILSLNANEAMVKRGPNFDPAHNNWEYFNLQRTPSGTTIKQRGTAEVKNDVGTCMGCHQGARDFDFICRSGHGCDPLPVSGQAVSVTQELDPTCGGVAP